MHNKFDLKQSTSTIEINLTTNQNLNVSLATKRVSIVMVGFHSVALMSCRKDNRYRSILNI